ncbi:MAG TPA: phage portal protein [Parvularcula sp.]|nr:phage portal protein [Parvularcula sp.]
MIPLFERKKSAARALTALSRPGDPVWTPRDYASLARAGFQKNVIAYRSIRLVSEAAASAPLRVVEAGRVMAAHPLLDLLNRPNPEQSGQTLLESLYGFLETAGNAYLEAVRLDGALRELWCLRPDRMKALAGAGGWTDGYEYGVDGKKTRFVRDAGGFLPVLHLKLFHPTNDHYGFSPLEAAATAVDFHNAALSWNKALLDNAARPSGALVYKGPEGAENLTAEQFERLKEELSSAYSGIANAGRPLVLDGGLDWRSMSLTPSDMDFVEAKNGAAREIALAFGVPPQLLGIPGDNTYANYREANFAFWRQTVLPLVRKTASALSAWLAPAFDGAVVELDAANIDALSADRDAHWARISAAGFLSDAEKRRALGIAEAQDD